MDLEWALANETIYLLQARPLTKITYQVSDEWTNADLKDGGVASAICTPIMYSMYKTVFESTMPGYFEQIKIGHPDKNKKWFDWWFGYPYWNLSAAKKCVGQLPGFVERNFDISLGITPNYDGNGQTTKLNIFSVIKGLRALYATNNSIANRIANCQMAIQKAHQSFHLYEKTNWADLSFEETVSLCESLFEEYLSFEKSYFLAIYDNSNMATFCQEAIQKHNAKNPQNLINYLDVIGGLENLAHLRANESLQKLAREINKNESARQFFLLQTPETLCKKLLAKEPFLFCDELNACIITYKHHSPRELDLMTPNWDENPTPAIELLLYFIQKGEPETEGSVNDKFAGQWKNIANKRIKSKIQKHRDLLWWREEMRDNSTKMYYYVRKCLLHMGVHLAKNNATANADDVFFLSYPELIHLAKGIDSAKHLSIIAKNKCLYESFRNYSRPNEIRPYGAQSATQSDATNADVLQGIAGASGIYRGRAVVITHVFDGHKLNDGDILVTVYTDPGWTVYFSKINALITETGGMLSHGAVISREYGIPAVLGVKDATQLIKTGDIIEVNGQLGTVQIIR
jgi:pyruvate,water dikinase